MAEKNKNKELKIKINMTFEEAMKKALNTPVLNKKQLNQAKKNVKNIGK